MYFVTENYKPLYFEKIPVFYTQMICAFNKSKCINFDCFCENIVNQPLWGNEFIKCKTGNKEDTLYFKSWIECSLLKIGDLKFLDGKIDENFVMQKVKMKANILSELHRLNLALKPYKNLLANV